MHVVVLGVGAMGSLFGAYLAPLVDITLVGRWPAQLAALRRPGLTLIRPDGRRTQQALHATDDVRRAAPADVVLVLVKSHQTARAAAQAAEVLRPQGIAVTLQNGLGNREILADAVGAARVAQGVTSEGATLLAPGEVRHAGHGLTHLAATPQTAARLSHFATLLRQAGLETQLSEQVDGLVWGKLAVNAGINPLTALLRVRNGFLVKNAAARRLMSAAAEEVAAVAAAAGITLPYPNAAQQAATVATATAENYSSMLQDVLRGAPTEIDAICGAVVRHGQAVGVTTPLNEALWRLVRAAETGARRPVQAGDVNALLAALQAETETANREIL